MRGGCAGLRWGRDGFGKCRGFLLGLCRFCAWAMRCFCGNFVLRICEGRPGVGRDMNGVYAEAVLGLCDGMAGDNSMVAQNGFHRFHTGCGGRAGLLSGVFRWMRGGWAGSLIVFVAITGHTLSCRYESIPWETTLTHTQALTPCFGPRAGPARALRGIAVFQKIHPGDVVIFI